ncbi:hypothetical protein IFM89_004780, partial [Coptis chinensis]
VDKKKMVVIVSETGGADDENETRGESTEQETIVKEAATEDYETASEGEEEDADADAEEQPAPAKDDSFEDALTDEELKQRALAQANDAKAQGNELFGAGQYEDALSKYEFALYVAPEASSCVELRSICHANRAICYSKLGKYDDTIKECTKALEFNSTYIKALLRRGEAHEKLEHFEEAIADMKRTLELDPSNDQAQKTIRRLEPLAAEKREKMKEEMIGKLKDIGNGLLGRFGMSVDNFKAVKDPNTGSYSISFQR